MIQSPSGIAMSAITISGRQSAMTFIASVTPPPAWEAMRSGFRFSVAFVTKFVSE
jgi:hypothetical protein